jgi:hypothetical protein
MVRADPRRMRDSGGDDVFTRDAVSPVPGPSGCSRTTTAPLGDIRLARPRSKHLVVCIDNEGYPASLEKRKIYVALRDAEAERHWLLWVVDESGDDYLCPKTFFRSIELPQSV